MQIILEFQSKVFQKSAKNLRKLWFNSWFPGFEIMLDCTPMADDRW